MSDFDPNGVGIANGNLFGFPVSETEADIIVVPVPWDATASYGKGTSKGPDAILEASTQLDFYHPELSDAYKTKVYMSPVSREWQDINDELCTRGTEYIRFLEEGGKVGDNAAHMQLLEDMREAQQALRDNLFERSREILRKGATPAVLGGEHSTPFGLIRALDEHYANFGILQIDAHADLRNAYEGFEQSHASIMYNVLEHCPNLVKLVQVGIRDIAQSEVDIIESNADRINTFFDWHLKQSQFEGKTWAKQVQEIISCLPHHVYISFDIDGLCPELCPNTGTPVVGGFSLQEITYLFFELVRSGREIIGFDLNEVAPGESGDWDANVGARALWNLVCATEKSRRLHRTKK